MIKSRARDRKMAKEERNKIFIFQKIRKNKGKRKVEEGEYYDYTHKWHRHTAKLRSTRIAQFIVSLFVLIFDEGTLSPPIVLQVNK